MREHSRDPDLCAWSECFMKGISLFLPFCCDGTFPLADTSVDVRGPCDVTNRIITLSGNACCVLHAIQPPGRQKDNPLLTIARHPVDDAATVREIATYKTQAWLSNPEPDGDFLHGTSLFTLRCGDVPLVGFKLARLEHFVGCEQLSTVNGLRH
jgi:hypothetical protein